jgi:ATP-binding cassette subfamily B protein
MYQCFSGLDAESEILAQEGLNATMQGRIVEIGSPEDLRKQSGLYARLASLHFDIQ